MKQTRKIRKVWKSKPTIEGAGVHLKRVFGFSQVPMFDPFLLLDDFRSDNPEHFIKGFPWHPHRGIETITYVLRGDVEHGDSMGNKGVISSGDVQWMTAGRGSSTRKCPGGTGWPHGWLPTLGQSPQVRQNDGASLSGRASRQSRRWFWKTAPQLKSSAAGLVTTPGRCGKSLSTRNIWM